MQKSPIIDECEEVSSVGEHKDSYNIKKSYIKTLQIKGQKASAKRKPWIAAKKVNKKQLK